MGRGRRQRPPGASGDAAGSAEGNPAGRGCGTGETTLLAARQATTGGAVGVDLSAPMLRQARHAAAAAGIGNAVPGGRLAAVCPQQPEECGWYVIPVAALLGVRPNRHGCRRTSAERRTRPPRPFSPAVPLVTSSSRTSCSLEGGGTRRQLS
ncbi:class I SAM-dependent methyltransferase [Nonomuraea bangladeshensis]|uniref:Class I SAM-dependent methyltransferase n=1 Tax=Nonomuraea bangladeshensis TaxID=404385 RepID=A0ABV3HKZ9_9ACTN